MKVLSLKDIENRLNKLVEGDSTRLRIEVKDSTLKAELSSKVYTYFIFAKEWRGLEEESFTYLGGTCLRKNLAPGEEWPEGTDLPSGPCDEETWQEIVYAILSNELTTPLHTDSIAEHVLAAAVKTLTDCLRSIYAIIGRETTVEDMRSFVVDSLSSFLCKIPKSYYTILLTHDDMFVREAARKAVKV